MIPVADTKHVVEALALLTDVFKGKANIEGLLSAVVSAIQNLEDAAIDDLTNIVLSNAVGDLLDKYGAIVGVGRGALDDAGYRQAITLQIRVNRSNGTVEDILQVAALALTSFTYDEYYPAGFLVETFDASGMAAVISALGKAKAGGTYGVIHYTSWDESADFNVTWDDSTGTLAEAVAFTDSVSGDPNNVFIAAQVLTP